MNDMIEVGTTETSVTVFVQYTEQGPEYFTDENGCGQRIWITCLTDPLGLQIDGVVSAVWKDNELLESVKTRIKARAWNAPFQSLPGSGCEAANNAQAGSRGRMPRRLKPRKADD